MITQLVSCAAEHHATVTIHVTFLMLVLLLLSSGNSVCLAALAPMQAAYIVKTPQWTAQVSRAVHVFVGMVLVCMSLAQTSVTDV